MKVLSPFFWGILEKVITFINLDRINRAISTNKHFFTKYFEKERTFSNRHFPIVLLVLTVSLGLFLSYPIDAYAGHKPKEMSCGECHSVSGAPGKVVIKSQLIKNDEHIAQFQGADWNAGDELPCVYCHRDDTGIRTNMIGVKRHFETTLSRHDVEHLLSNQGGVVGDPPDQFDCVDCHDVDTLAYVGQGSTPGDTLNPNIHNVNAQAYGRTESTGGLDISATFIASPYNSPSNPSQSNALCTNNCHDSGLLDGAIAVPPLHGYPGTSVSLEGEYGYTSTVTGCLNIPGSTQGCHGDHDGGNNTNLITLTKAGGSYVTRSDCGVCHNFDDPTDGDFVTRSTSEYYKNGHGYINTNAQGQPVSIGCDDCHDSGTGHFDPADTEGHQLTYPVNTSLRSDLSTDQYPLYSICTNCHPGKEPHSVGAGMNVGCLDCHEIHGRGIEVGGGRNLYMLRREAPIGTPTVIISYENDGDYCESISPPPEGNYSNYLCDNADCHSRGPGAISTVMDVANTVNPHPVGPYTTGCDSCHTHDDPGGSMRATGSCTDCHGDAANQTNWPDGSSYEDRAGAHQKHVNATGLGNNSCGVCHPSPGGVRQGTGEAEHKEDAAPTERADVHNDGRAGAVASSFQTLYGSNDSDGLYSTNQTCISIDCHGNLTTPSWYSVATVDCDTCHSGVEGGTLGDGVPNGVFTDWTSRGHGSPAGGSFSSVLNGCDYCHQLDAGHFPTAIDDPYRLRFSATDNTLCLKCHESGSDPGIIENSAAQDLTDVTSGKDVGTSHFGSKHAGDEGGRFCWDCHDPHGGPVPPTGNILMVKSNLSKTADTYGIPLTTVTVSGFTGTNNVSFFVDTSTNDPREGICQACHDPTKGDPTTDTGSTKYWRSNGTDDPTGAGPVTSTHNDDKVCTQCHEHTNGFAGVGDSCGACHGNPPATGAHSLHSMAAVQDSTEDLPPIRTVLSH
jgi:predicted CxxxxCH...CXXCH cytochrome family protein